jgi:Zn-dependent metalloprotease
LFLLFVLLVSWTTFSEFYFIIQKFKKMKIKFQISLLVSIISLCFFTPLFAQVVSATPGSVATQVHTRDCANYNSFRNTPNAQVLLNTYADKISSSGIIHLDRTKTKNIGGSPALYQYFDLDPNTTFELISTIQSFSDSNNKINRYQQYYQGVPIDGGGYIAYTTDVPCDDDGEIIAIYPELATEINIDVGPIVNENDLANIIGNSNIRKQELWIAPNLLGNCTYNLAWKVDYQDSSFKRAWVDAKTGKVIKVTDVSKNLLAEIDINHPDYENGNDVQLDDYTDGTNTTFLQNMQSGDGLVKTYNYLGQLLPPDTENDWDEARLPSTQETVKWPDAIGNPSTLFRVYQGHYVATKVVDVFSTDLLPIRETSLLVNNTQNARSLYDSTIDDDGFLEHAWLEFGGLFCVYEVIGHELGHSIMGALGLGYDSDNGSATVQEGLADFFGIYAESRLSLGGFDWQMGDDIPDVARDFENLQYLCLDDVPDNADSHDSADPLRRWFYLLIEGSSNLGIQSVPMLDLMEIVMDIVALMPSNGNTEDFIETAQEWASMQNDNVPCSEVYTSMYNAFEAICAEQELSSDICIRIAGPRSLCEEIAENGNGNGIIATFTVANYDPNLTYEWYFPASWTVLGSVPNTNICYGPSLRVVDWPKYSFFPRNFTLRLSAVVQSVAQYDYHDVILLDCLGDDSDCPDGLIGGNGDTSFGIQSPTPNDNNQSSKIKSEEINLSSITRVMAYDFYGRIVFDGTPAEANIWRNKAKGLFIIAHNNDNGQIIKSEKVYFTN